MNFLMTPRTYKTKFKYVMIKMSTPYKHIKSFNFRSHNFMHRCLNHSILASLEKILREISNDKSNSQNGDSEDYQKDFQS